MRQGPEALLFQNNSNPALDRHWDQRESNEGPALDLWPWTARQDEVLDLLTPLRPVVFYDTHRKLAWDLGVTTGRRFPEADFTHWGGGTLPAAEVLRLGYVDLDVPLPEDYAWWRVAGASGVSGSRTAFFRYTNDVIPGQFARRVLDAVATAANARTGTLNRMTVLADLVR